MTTIIPQHLPCSPVYSTVGVQEYVLWKPTMFLHYFNDLDINVGIVVSSVEPDIDGSYNCYAVSIPANDETIVGPFDVIYSPTISITKAEYSTDVTVAALYTDYYEFRADFILTGEILTDVTFTGVVTENIDLTGVAEPAITLDW